MSAARDRLHAGGLVALGIAGFVTILTEALPAGLLPQIGADLRVGEALAGQWVSAYALGSLAAAIPLTNATRHWRRRPLLLTAMLGFALANGVTAVTDSFAFSLAARFVGGVSAGLLWALLAGYAVHLAPERLAGRAMAIAMAGTPVALSIGIPAGTMLGHWAGWRIAFATLSAIAIALAGWMRVRLPDVPGEEAVDRPSLRQVFALPGIRAVLLLTLCFVLAHNILYTYIVPLLARAGLVDQADRVLFIFGCAGLVSISVTGALIDRHLGLMTAVALLLFIGAAALLGVSTTPLAIYAAGFAWGLGFGGAATLFQTASARAAGPAFDVAQAMIVTAWNLAIAGGALLGGTLLDQFGATSLPWVACMLLVMASTNRPTSCRDALPA
ncbi:MFS transporter [Sphingobium yanoikuyae]|uniref:MFS transporter n=1 Tax=Sphingobium yanoikuyae TaxID=13690 RepID=UPI0022DE37F4|nr:MFS transporter [Sphingobium yanoikuyae]WBQ19213.1 MFS transporter [Sphingobium yanoikuyae]